LDNSTTNNKVKSKKNVRAQPHANAVNVGGVLLNVMDAPHAMQENGFQDMMVAVAQNPDFQAHQHQYVFDYNQPAVNMDAHAVGAIIQGKMTYLTITRERTHWRE